MQSGVDFLPPMPPIRPLVASAQSLIVPDQSPATYRPSEAPWAGSVMFPETSAHSKYPKLHQAVWRFYGIRLTTKPTASIRLQTISTLANRDTNQALAMILRLASHSK